MTTAVQETHDKQTAFENLVNSTGFKVEDLNLETLTPTELFKKVLEKVADLHGLTLDYKQEGWNVDFNNAAGDSLVTLLSYDFGLNNAQAFTVAKHKALASKFLQQAGVPHVEHYMMTKTSLFNDVDPRKVYEDFRQKYPLPVVVKQANGGGGKNIHFAFNEFDLIMGLAELKSKKVQVALSPFYDFGIEYRCTVLDGKMIMAYGKTKGANHQNNLSKGAQVVEVPESLRSELEDLAVSTNKALGLRFTNIDIIETNQGLRVLEVNGTVTMKRVLSAGYKYIYNTIEVYYKAVSAVLNQKGLNTPKALLNDGVGVVDHYPEIEGVSTPF